jgi:hypothetical protein
MCEKHQPIIVYDAGGTYQCCEKCGIMLTNWQENAGNGKHKYGKDKKKEKPDSDIGTQEVMV